MAETPPPLVFPSPHSKHRLRSITLNRLNAKALKATPLSASTQTGPGCWLGSHHHGAIDHGFSRGDRKSSRDAGPFFNNS